ncbi:hypothetical protein [Rhizobium sp. ICMP 5592]|uniref:hypothetical protein n=1 Tax=Rhizobium sp. ICMP 5592 TaxID=2292445 RepID=UPI0012980725|nr:hypothetical protein [Rhizobium sp. ICMP 5592]MQB43217.1 hypothetical protein [Rhizobium sp. ICMP 5592]
MGIIVWCTLFAIVVFFAFFIARMTSQNKEDGLHDTGLAILEFGRAFPTEAIRQLQTTANGQAVFVRLHDDKAGFMRSLRNHYSVHLIEPGRARAKDSGSGRGLTIDFLDAPHHNGTFEFATPAEAAEVSLWLLGNYVAGEDPKPSATDTDGKGLRRS